MDPMGKGVSCGENVGNFEPSGVWLYFCLRTGIPWVMKQLRMRFCWCLMEDFHRHEAVKQWGSIQCICFIYSGPVLVKPALSGYISFQGKRRITLFEVLVIRYRLKAKQKHCWPDPQIFIPTISCLFFWRRHNSTTLIDPVDSDEWKVRTPGKAKSRVYGLMDKQ